MNRFVGFRAVVRPADGSATLRVTASSLYRAFVNGRFAGYGPARAAHGHFRVDDWNLTEHLRPGPNLIAIEVVGYNVNSYYLLDQPAFLQAEVVTGEAVLAATRAKDGAAFEAVLLEDHLQRVERYSVARTFSEAFRLRPGIHLWRTDVDASVEPVACAVSTEGVLLPRRVPYPDFTLLPPARHVAAGRFSIGPMPEEPYRDWTLTGLGPDLKGYPEDVLETIPSFEIQTFEEVERQPLDRRWRDADTLTLTPQTWHLLDFGTNRTGFLGFEVTCDAPARLFLTFDEILTGGDIDPRRLRCLNVIACDLAPGTYAVETFEPYTLRHLKLLAVEGAPAIQGLYLREYANPEAGMAQFDASDERLNRLFEAGRETLRQNAVDLLMDCPSRERAGWPCDSFFTARAAFLLTGSTAVEEAFLENYALAPQLDSLPAGMLPMNYPADHPNGDFLGERDAQFIPNWPLWLILQLEEYLERSGDRALVDTFEPKVRALLAWFEPYVNAEGLLEDLDGWIFLEWSKANEFVRGVNYPTNMLWAAALDAAGRLYESEGWQRRARRVRATVAAQAFDGTFFVDQAMREGGVLRRTPHRTELCQYYAFYFGVASPETHGALWQTLCSDFGPRRDAARTHPEVHPAAMLIGYFLRLELLGNYGRGTQVLDEAVDYFLPMAEATGTLWEHAAPTASCCHGFASHVAVFLCRHVFGAEHMDPLRRTS